MIFLLLFYIALFIIVGKTAILFTNIRFKLNFSRVFTELTIGFFLTISLFSIVKTTGVSISSCLLIFAFFWGLNNKIYKKPQLNDISFDWPEIVEITVLILLFYVINDWKYISEDGLVQVINWDALYDVSRAIYLNNSGVENSGSNLIQIAKGTQPYHYFEAWSVAFFSTCFNTNYWLTQHLIFHPLMLGVAYGGFRSLSGKKPGHLGAVLFGIVLLFSGGFFTEFLGGFSFFRWTRAFRSNIIDEPWWTRLSVLYPIILISVHFFLRKDYKNALFSILVIPFLSVTPAIPIIITCFITVMYLSIFRKESGVKFRHLFVPIGVAVIYKLFYVFFIDKSDFIPIPEIDDVLLPLSSFSVLKAKSVIIIEKIIQTVILYFPILILFTIGGIANKSFKINLLKWKKSTTLAIFFLVLLAVVSLVMWQLLSFVFGSSFFYYYTMIPFFNIVFVLLLWFAYKESGYKKYYVIFGLALMTFYVYRSVTVHEYAKSVYFVDKYDKQFLKNVQTLWSENNFDHGLSLGVKFENHSEIKHPFFNDGLSLCGYYLYGIAQSPAFVSLSRADLPEKQMKSSTYSESFTKSSSFYHYVHSPTNEKLSINEYKRNFILEYKIRFGVVSPKGEISANLLDLIDTVLIDKVSKEKFILFNNNDNSSR